MTNFEKWKENLKPEDLIITDFCIIGGVVVFDGHGDRCECCPAKDTCSAQCDDEIPCGSQFLSWAKSPVKENEEED